MKIFIKRIYYSPILLCTSYLDVSFQKVKQSDLSHTLEGIETSIQGLTSSFDELLLKDNSFRIHHRNLQKLTIGAFKFKLGLAAEIIKNVFPIIENPYDVRNETKFKSRNVHTVRYGIETASFVEPRIWSSILRSYKECSSVNEFKAEFKFWYPENCPCKLCKMASVK